MVLYGVPWVTVMLFHDLINIVYCLCCVPLFCKCNVMAAAWLSALQTPFIVTYFSYLSLNSSCTACPPSSVLWEWMWCIWFNVCVPMLPFATFVGYLLFCMVCCFIFYCFCLSVYSALDTVHFKDNNSKAQPAVDLGLGSPRQGWKGVPLMTASYSAYFIIFSQPW